MQTAGKSINADRAETRPLRRHDIDWLRVLAMGMVFVFHNARFFDHFDWHVKNRDQHLAVDVFFAFVVY